MNVLTRYRGIQGEYIKLVEHLHMGEAEKEKIKLTASWLNIMAAGIMVTGVIVPGLNAFYALDGAATPATWRVLTGSLILIFASFGLHYGARLVMERLSL
ncbi:hypothetical protein GCM10011316_33790 [Roseibium aquae]|uniref:Uncharacterized protein n=1 Tax=Roseibium aquae TaxID=1323746 RepID=A0A916TMB5_9HYPH|nr:hypothetical protein [Roseibium aquae]GGB58984.1 hypothetical protein GCM10011316_33790 [Roseibium aquae]